MPFRLTEIGVQSANDPQRPALEHLLLEFDQSWHEQLLEEKARQLTGDAAFRRLGLLEMVKIDLEKHRQRGRKPTVEAYLHFYPVLGNSETVPAELLLAEYRVRRQFGETAELDDFAHRFPLQADALRQLLVPSSPGDTINEISRRSSLGGVGRASESLPEQFGPYRVLKKLGEGGMGAVYLVHNTDLDRREALKVSRLPEDQSRRFFTEAQAAARTNHPNICQVYDFGEIGGVHFLTMEYAEGGTLADLIRTGEPIPAERAATLVRSLALALDRAHELKVYHRDLKPANVLLTKDGEPKITDFGLACVADQSRHTADGTVLGTPHYMAPEQAKGEVGSLDHACDIYSLGIILYELLTGQVPFLGSHWAVLHQHTTAPPKPPSLLRPGLDVRLEAICLKALAKAPAERHPSMGVFAQALDGFLRNSQVVPDAPFAGAGRASPDSQPLPRSFSRSWMWLAGPVLLVAVVLLVLNGDEGKRPAPPADADEKLRVVSNLDSGRPSLPLPVEPPPKTVPEVVGTAGDRRPEPPPLIPPAGGRRALVGGGQQWQLEGKELVSLGTGITGLIFGDPNWKDYTFAYTVKKTSGSHGVITYFRKVNFRNTYLFYLGERNNSRTLLAIAADGQYGWPGDKLGRRLPWRENKQGYLQINQPHKVRIEVRGKTAQFYLDEVQLFTYDKLEHLSGAVGFATKDTAIRVSDIKVTSSAGLTLWEGPPELGR